MSGQIEPDMRPFKKDQRIVIIGKKHPHTGEQGIVNGEYIESTKQFVVELLNCAHGTNSAAALAKEIKIASESKDTPAPEPARRGPGQPSTFTQEIADQLCMYLSMGESLRTACRHEGMPVVATVFNWFRTQPEFLEQYTRAKEEAADAMAEDILDISDDGSNDYMERTGRDGSTYEAYNGDAVQRSRLRIETRKWLMEKYKAKKYGPRIDVTSGGEKIERGMSIEEIDAVLARAEAEKQAKTPQEA